MAAPTDGFIDVGAVADYPVGKLTRTPIPGKDIWVLRRPDNTFVGVKNTCPHRGAPICLGRVDGTFVPSQPGQFELGLIYRTIRCPHHGWEFDLETGYPIFTELRDRLVRYEVRVEAERVKLSRKGR